MIHSLATHSADLLARLAFRGGHNFRASRTSSNVEDEGGLDRYVSVTLRL